MAAGHLLSMASRVPTHQFRRGGAQWRCGGLADGGGDAWRKFGLQLAQSAEYRALRALTGTPGQAWFSLIDG